MKTLKATLFSLSIFWLLSSCERCKTCYYVIETTTHSAFLKCSGESNNYPHYIEDKRIWAGNSCDINEDEYPIGVLHTQEICERATATIRGYWDCN